MGISRMVSLSVSPRMACPYRKAAMKALSMRVFGVSRSFGMGQTSLPTVTPYFTAISLTIAM